MNKRSRRSFVVALAATFMMSFLGGSQPAKAMDTSALANAFDTLHWVAYSPLNYNPDINKQPNEASVKADLETLKRNGFGGIVTYGCTGSNSTLVPKLSNELGLKLIVGVWEPRSDVELNAAVEAAKFPNVLAVCVGNERLWDSNEMADRDPKNHYTLDQLKNAMNKVRSQSKKPVTTSQQHKSYLSPDAPALIEACDFEFPTIHPFWNAIIDKGISNFNGIAGANWTVEQLQAIRNKSGSKLVVAKEVGYPVKGGGQKANETPNMSEEGKRLAAQINEQTQTEYYVKLTESVFRHNFCYFEAFDQNWKNHNCTEPHWGLFTVTRSPRPAMAAIKAVW